MESKENKWQNIRFGLELWVFNITCNKILHFFHGGWHLSTKKKTTNLLQVI